MKYLTFVSRAATWRLYEGIGDGGELVTERNDAAALHDLSALQEPVLWACSENESDDTAVIQRMRLPDLTTERVPWSGRRIGSLTSNGSSSGNEQVVLLEVPGVPDEQPRLWLWKENGWNVVESTVRPDISSRLAWLDAARVVYESVDRKLTILDLDAGRTEVGPPGRCPSAASDIREWYAVSGGRVVCFPFDRPFESPPKMLNGFAVGNASTLRTTRDGQVLTWTEPTTLYEVRGYVQQRGGSRMRFRQLDDGIGSVLGPFA